MKSSAPNPQSEIRNPKLRDYCKALAAEEAALREGGGPAGLARQHKLGRLTARERIAALLDQPDGLLELGLWAAHGMYREWGAFIAAGVLTGIGRVSGRSVLIIANDATVKAGAFVPMTCKKILRAQRIAFESALPLVYLVDSSGVFLPMQDEVFPDEDDFGRIFRNNAVISAAGIPQFAAIMGNCVAGGAYLPVLCDKVLMTEGSGLYLAGPSLVKAAIGQEVDSETLGGATMHAEISGTVDFKEKDDVACLKRLRSLIALLPADSENGGQRREDGGRTPDAGGQTPDAGGQTPDAGGQTPDAGGQTPDAGGQTPDAGGQTPDAGGQTPDAGGQTPDAGRQTPDAGTQNPELRTQNFESQSETRNPKPETSSPPETIYELLSLDGRREYDARDLLACIVDANSIDEYKAGYGKSLVCAYARIGGQPVGVVANQRVRVQSPKTGLQMPGVIYADSAEKAARFVLDCNQARLPLIFFQDVSGFMVGKDAEQSGIIRAGAQLVNAVSNSTVPKLTVVVGGSYGAGNYALCGKAFDPRFIFAWPNARYAVMGAAQAGDVVSSILARSAQERSPEELARLREQVKQSYVEQADIRYGAARGWVDAIIQPHTTRAVLIAALACARRAPPKAHFHTGVIQV